MDEVYEINEHTYVTRFVKTLHKARMCISVHVCIPVHVRTHTQSWGHYFKNLNSYINITHHFEE